ncbi:hypothetical protein TorRG33x02_347970 [Trema orientale]|uniref:Uncharacterized protein n=1 Tax=Trema orientale TaxID=63057 RepID=A0A2P5AKU6_TREOI|nr:hypothetical protein TorRG33x02_347970 [Trema orientale]
MVPTPSILVTKAKASTSTGAKRKRANSIANEGAIMCGGGGPKAKASTSTGAKRQRANSIANEGATMCGGAGTKAKASTSTGAKRQRANSSGGKEGATMCGGGGGGGGVGNAALPQHCSSSGRRQAVTDEDMILLPGTLNDYLVKHGLNVDWLEESQRKNLENKWKELKVAECKCLFAKSKFEIQFQTLKLKIFELLIPN